MRGPQAPRTADPLASLYLSPRHGLVSLHPSLWTAEREQGWGVGSGGFLARSSSRQVATAPWGARERASPSLRAWAASCWAARRLGPVRGQPHSRSGLQTGEGRVVSQRGAGCPGPGPQLRGGEQSEERRVSPMAGGARRAAAVPVHTSAHTSHSAPLTPRGLQGRPLPPAVRLIISPPAPCGGRWNAGLRPSVGCYLHPDVLSGRCLPDGTCQGVLSAGCHSTGWGPLGLAFVSWAGPGAWQEAWTGLGRWAPHWGQGAL